MTVWCRQTWLSTLPSEYLVCGCVTVSSIASLMAMPRLPGQCGSSASSLRPNCGLVAGTGMDRRAPGVHQHPAIGLLLVADLDHIDVALQPEQLAGQGERGSPLARARFRGQPLGAGVLVEVSLRHRSIGLVAAGRTGAFVLVINVGRRFERALQPHRPQQRRRPPQRIDLAHRFRDFDPAVRGTFPAGRGFREKSASSSPARPAGACPDAAAAAAVRENRPADCTSCLGISACDNKNRVVWLIESWTCARSGESHQHSENLPTTIMCESAQTSQILAIPCQ